jgi:transitional endoplasmic reticulum ATPase
MREVLVEIPSVKWEDVGGLDNVKQEIHRGCGMANHKTREIRADGYKASKRHLTYLGLGYCKTLVAQAVANESNAIS